MASVLDTFYILFKSDAKDVKDGAKDAETAVDGLESGIAGADKTSAQLGKKFNALATQALAAFASVYTVTQLISSARGIAEQSAELDVLSDVLGESASELVNWGRAVENMGGDSKAFQSSLQGLAGSLNDALISGSNAATIALSKMGISARDANSDLLSVLKILPELARGFQGLTRESALARGKSLGLDTGTILLLMQGEKGVRALVDRQREMNRVSDAQIDNLRLLKAKWTEYKNQISDVGTVLLSEFLPYLTLIENGVKAFAGLISDNSDMVLTFFKGAGVLVGALAVKAFLLALPFMLTVAAIAAVAFGIGLLIEDITKFVNGQDSLLGKAADRWDFVGDSIEFVKNRVSELIELFGRAKEALSGISFPDVFDSAKESAGGFFDRLDKGYKGLKGSSFGDFLSDAKHNLSLMNSTPITALGAQAAAGAVGSTRNSTSTVSVGAITIETSAIDAAGLAGALTSELENQLSNLVENSDDGTVA